MSIEQYIAPSVPSEQKEFIDCIKPEQARNEAVYSTFWMSDAKGTPGRLFDGKGIDGKGIDATCWDP